jgi:hypothetical protein
MPNILIDLAAEFTGKKAFDKAGKSTTSLEKSVKSLGRTLGLTLSASAVLAYGKASVKAASDDIKAQKQLALALKNVGLERDAATAEGYIQRLESEFGIVDDKLRPAYASLSIATKNTAETQRILGIALDISASTGKDLEAVVAALTKAYLGNNATLSRLGVGIAKADLKTKSFKEITDQLAVTFAGSAKASADSFAGSIDKLSIASNNAKEIIGTSLIGALQSLGNDKNIENLATGIESAAKSLANFVDSIVYLKEQIKSIPGFGLVSFLGSGVSDLLGRFSPQRLAELIKAIQGFQGMGNVAMTGGSNMDTQKFEAQQKKLAAAQVAATKKAATAKIAADKKAAANKAKLDKAAAVLDIQKIQIAAALKGKISEEEKTRLLLMQAILDEDADAAEILSKKLEEIQKQNAKIAADLLAIGQAKDPFATWAGSLSLALAALGKVGLGISAISGTMIPGVTYNPGQNPDRNYDEKVKAAEKAAADKAAADKAAADKAAADKEAADRAAAIKPTFEPDDTIDDILAKVENVAEAAAEAAQAAAASVTESQTTVDALAASATNGYGVAGTNFNPTQSRDRNFDSGYMTPAVTVNVNVEGSVISQSDMTKIVADALIVADTEGLSTRRPGAIGFKAE